MSHTSALPRLTLSRGVLSANAERLLGAGGFADLRFDAYGHGVADAAHVVHAAGATEVLVDTAADADRLRASGIPAIAHGEPSVPAAELFGLPGTGGDAVACFAGRVLSTKPLRAGDAVSYGYTHRAERPTTVALTTGGYAQGIVRALGNRAGAEVGGSIRRIVGRIAMDVCVIDLDGADAAPGDPVTFFGGRGPARNALARWTEATGLGALELLVVVGAHSAASGTREWVE